MNARLYKDQARCHEELEVDRRHGGRPVPPQQCARDLKLARKLQRLSAGNTGELGAVEVQNAPVQSRWRTAGLNRWCDPGSGPRLDLTTRQPDGPSMVRSPTFGLISIRGPRTVGLLRGKMCGADGPASRGRRHLLLW